MGVMAGAKRMPQGHGFEQLVYGNGSDDGHRFEGIV